MGIGDYWNKAQPYLDPGNLLAGGPKSPGGENVGGVNYESQWALQPIPGTNYAYNPVTGQTQVIGATGTPEVAGAPNLSQQGATSSTLQQLYLNQYKNAVDNAAATRAGQNTLAGDFRDVIAGRAPSVAETQLQTGMTRIGQDQNAMAAGASGQNAFGARRIAAQNIARASGDLSGQMALTRAAETAAARGGLASLYGQQVQADAAAQNVASGAGLGYGKLGEEAEADRIGANMDADKENAKQRASVLQGAGNLLGLLG